MAKSTSNRQSLTMPIQETARLALKESDPSKSTDRSQSLWKVDPRDPRSFGYTPHSIAVNNGMYVHRPQTPTSPSSPGPSSQFYPAGSLNTTPPRHDSLDATRAFFSNLRAAQSGTIIPESSVHKFTQDSSSSIDGRKPGKTKSTPDFKAKYVDDPVPDLPLIDLDNQYSQNYRDAHRIPRRPVNQPSAITIPRSTNHYTFGPGSPAIDHHDSKKNGRRFFGMKRNAPGRGEDGNSYSKPSTPVLTKAPDIEYGKPRSRDHSTGRNPSPLVETDDLLVPPPGTLKDQRSQSFRDGPGSVLFHGLSKGAGKAAAGLSKTRKWLGNATTTHTHKNLSSGLARQEPIPNYQVINLTLPLQEQTRNTRIAKRLEDSKDKTEFWMPALPWRCIDYLNFNGCEAEGLYRVPGSDREIKLWWQKFDQEHDINLFDQEGLYDVNVVGSLFKMWLRNLPEPILEEAIQIELITKYEDQKQAPEELKEVLSRLPPWNYYLLFAITCHLSLLNAYEEKNKMSLQNLYICVGPGLRMKQRCFTWLVGDWRSCWTGCNTEKEALEDEYRLFSGDDRKTSFSPTASDEGQDSSESLQKNQLQEPHSQIQHQDVRRKENRPARIDPGKPKDDTHLMPYQNGRLISPLDSPTHGISNSRIPELNLPGKMSPLFAPDVSD